MKKLMFTAVALLAFAPPARAESWTCTYKFGTVAPNVVHFYLSPPDLIETKTNERYRVSENNGYGLVATSSISQIETGHQKATVGAATVVINKETGEFWWATAIAGQAVAVNQPVQGKCIKD